MILLIVYIVDKVIDLVKRERRRLNKSSTNTVITRQSFKEEVRKTLFILIFIDDYNHYIKDVNLIN